MFAFLRRRRRRKLSAHAPPAGWHRIAEANIPSFARAGVAAQAELLTHARILLDEKHWEGCGGLELTEEIRVTIAVQAARLLLGNPGDYFPDVRTVLVYPSTSRRPAPATREAACGRSTNAPRPDWPPDALVSSCSRGMRCGTAPARPTMATT